MGGNLQKEFKDSSKAVFPAIKSGFKSENQNLTIQKPSAGARWQLMLDPGLSGAHCPLGFLPLAIQPTSVTSVICLNPGLGERSRPMAALMFLFPANVDLLGLTMAWRWNCQCPLIPYTTDPIGSAGKRPTQGGWQLHFLCPQGKRALCPVLHISFQICLPSHWSHR